MPDVPRCVVLVEPICRGSRLQILVNAMTAMRGRAEVIVVTRSDYDTPHFRELVAEAGVNPRIVTAPTDLGGAWMKNLSVAEFSAFRGVLADIDRELSSRGGTYDLVFMALDDCLEAFARAAWSLRSLRGRARTFCVKYRVQYLFSLRADGRVRDLVLRVVTRLALGLSGARLVAFDERLADHEAPGKADLLPDPWFGDYSPARRAEGRLRLGLNEGDIALLTLGKQDRRKGIDFLIEAFPDVPPTLPVRLVVVGRIDAPHKEAFARLIGTLGTKVIHVDEFVPEADLPAYFAASDAFLLPYNKEFTATSGTLARAAASGVGVLSTSHGLVGYRVREHGLGETFGVGDSASFVQAVRRLAGRDASERMALQRRNLQFAESCALPRFEAAWRAVLGL